jgi:hypothetical protein
MRTKHRKPERISLKLIGNSYMIMIHKKKRKLSKKKANKQTKTNNNEIDLIEN